MQVENPHLYRFVYLRVHTVIDLFVSVWLWTFADKHMRIILMLFAVMVVLFFSLIFWKNISSSPPSSHNTPVFLPTEV